MARHHHDPLAAGRPSRPGVDTLDAGDPEPRRNRASRAAPGLDIQLEQAFGAAGYLAARQLVERRAADDAVAVALLRLGLAEADAGDLRDRVDAAGDHLAGVAERQAERRAHRAPALFHRRR